MLKASLSQESVELETHLVIWQAAIGAFAKPGNEPALLRNGGETVLEPCCGERQLLAARFPTKFVDEELWKLAGLKQ
jgi:hypothetical protein